MRHGAGVVLLRRARRWRAQWCAAKDESEGSGGQDQSMRRRVGFRTRCRMHPSLKPHSRNRVRCTMVVPFSNARHIARACSAASAEGTLHRNEYS